MIAAAAAAFCLCFEAIAEAIGRAAALLHPTVQAARRYWVRARGGS